MAGRVAGVAADDPAVTVPALLRTHPAVAAVSPVGSRAEGRALEISDWDFSVETDAFGAVARDLPGLVAPLGPIAAQWDRYAPHRCFMLILPGPRKVDLLFLDEPQEWSPQWEPAPETLPAIDDHFWDWALWLEQKLARGDREAVEHGLVDLHRLLLAPLGAPAPGSLPEAVEVFVAARDRLERALGVTVSRGLEREVRPVLERGGA